MPSGYKIYRIDGSGQPVITDLDSIFEPRQSGDPTAPATGFIAGDTNQDLSQRYMPVASGDVYSDNVDFKTPSGTDLRNVFAAIGSANTVTFAGMADFQTAAISANTTGEQISAVAFVQFNTNGSTLQSEFTTRNASTVDSNNLDAKWFKDAPQGSIGSEYEISIDDSGLNFTTGGPNPVIINNTAPHPTFVSLSVPQSFSVECQGTGGSGGNEAFADGSVIFSIRKIGTTKVYTKTIQYNVASIPI